MKKTLLFTIMALVMTGLAPGVAAAAPQIAFVEPPTPTDGATIDDTSVEIEVSITDPNLQDVIFSWDGTGHSLYDDSLVLMFNFDNVAALGENYAAAGDVVKDLSRWGNHGYLSDEALDPAKVPTWISYGKYGGAFDFTGNGVDSGQSIRVPHSDSLNPYDSDFAIAVWILTRDDVDGDILRKGSTGTASTNYKLEHSPGDNSDRFSLNFTTDGTSAMVTSVAAYNDYQWHFVVAQRKGNSAELWIDGVLDGTASVTGSISNTANLAVGSKDTQNDDFINSSLDEVRIYMRSFNQDEIQELYYSNLNKYAADSWTLYVNQSNLTNAEYTYQATAINSTPETASTEQRSLTVAAQGGGATTLVPAGAEWKYNDTGTDLHSLGWPSVDDSGWAYGPAQLGYGLNGEVTTISYGPDSGNKYPCYYFRHTFNVPVASQIGDLKLRLIRDDGAVVYLNGAEIVRSNMPGGTIYYDTWASEVVGGTDETTWWEFDVDSAGLVDGTNVLAVEIHQINATSSDVSFDLELAEAEHIRKGPYLFYTGSNTEMKILWQMDVAQACTLEWGTDPANLIESAVTTEFGSDHQHQYVIGADPGKPPLVPGTKYYYRLTDAYNETYTGSFIAAPEDNTDDLKFLVFGDVRADAGLVPYAYDGVCDTMNTFLAANPGYQTITFLVGDWINDDTENDWQNMFFNRTLSNALQLHANMPINGCVGNHDMNINGGAVYEKYYPYPYEPSGRYWSFDYGPVHFAIVDQYTSYSSGSAQLLWLDNDLATSDKLWKIIILHEPGYSAGPHPDNTSVQNYIQPLCLAHGVDIVFGGHNHNYARCVVDGIQHVTTGAGGAPVRPVNLDTNQYIVYAESNLEFCEIEIQGDTLYFTARRLDLSVMDSFSKTISWPKATQPNPTDGAENVSQDPTLSWMPGAGAISHNVYLGTDSANLPLESLEQTTASYTPATLNMGTIYYWRIDEVAGDSTVTQGNVWNFTTIDNPQQATNPNPANGAVDMEINTDLSWNAGIGASSHNVYFGTDPDPHTQAPVNRTVNSYDPGLLNPATTYYWAIDELDELDVVISVGPTWSFTTVSAPGQASSPNPGDALTDVDIDADMSWTPGSGTISHDVYFGINFDDVNNATDPNIAPGRGNQIGTTFDPGSMDYVTRYYWRIDEVGPGGTTTGQVWSFTTVPPPPPGQATDPSPADGAVDIDVNDDLSWTAGSDANSHDVYFSTEYPIPLFPPPVKQEATTYDPGTLEEGITYYWRIDTYNIYGDKTVGVDWSFTTYIQAPGNAIPSAPIDGQGSAVDVNDVGVSIILAWLSGDRAASHDVYFGASYAQVFNADNTSPEFKGNILQENGTVIPDVGTYFTWDPVPGDGVLPYESSYWWRIDEINPGGVTKGNVWNFTTESDTYPPIFVYPPDPGSITAHSATISWTTNEQSDSLVDYGETTYYGSSVYDSAKVTSHSITLTGLLPATTYYYMATSTDSAGNWASEVGPPFTTLENTPPVAVDDSATTNEATPVVIDVLANDSDFDGDDLTVDSVTQGTNGSVVDNGDGTVTYTPTSAAPYIDTFTYTVIDGFGGTAGATVTVDVREPYVDYTAYDEIAIFGTVTGSFIDTQVKDSSYEVIEEGLDKPNKNAASVLEHKWLINVPGTGPQGFHVNAYRDNYDTADNFVFAYSTDDLTYTEMLTVTKTADDGMYQTYTLPDSISGTVYIRVTDTHYQNRELVLGQVHVNHMFIRCETPVPDTAPPTPNPLTWSVVPHATGSTSISMTATTASDISGVEYYFACITDAAHDSGWQNNPTYEDTELGTGIEYTYQVKARDKSPTQNETGWSTEASATPVDVPPAAPTGLAATPGDSQVSLDWNDNTETDLAGYNVYRREASGSYDTPLAFVTESAYVDNDVLNGTTYYYVVKAVDQASNESGNSNEVSVTPDSVQAVSVSSIDMAVVPGKKYYATATVAITPGLDGATVVGDWYFKGALRTTGDTAVTSGGIAEFTSFETPGRSGDIFMFVVTDIIASGYIYDESGNVETSDSIAIP